MKLTSWEKRSALTIYNCIFPSGANETLNLGARDLPFERFLDDMFENSSFLSAIGIRLGLFLMHILPFLFIGKLKFFSGLSEQDKGRYIEKWQKNKIYIIRQLALFVKMVGVFGYCGFPEVQHQMGIVKEKQFPPM